MASHGRIYACLETAVVSVSKDLVNKFKFPTIESNVPLKIHGFNSTKSIDTKNVKMTFKLGNNITKIPAICIDKIKTKFTINNVDTNIAAFSEKGYELADRCLSKSPVVDNIDMILGTDFGHILPMRYKVFGDSESKSCFIQTPVGVVLSGNVAAMMSNLDYLPHNMLRCEAGAVAVDAPCPWLRDASDAAQSLSVLSPGRDEAMYKPLSDMYEPDTDTNYLVVANDDHNDNDIDALQKQYSQTLNSSPVDVNESNETDTNLKLV